MIRYLIVIGIVAACLSISSPMPAGAQEQKIMVVAVQVANGEIEIIKSFAISSSLYEKLLKIAQEDKYYEPLKSAKPKVVEAKKSKKIAELHFTRSSPGCTWVYYWGKAYYVCD